jgi:hypothetical protein
MSETAEETERRLGVKSDTDKILAALRFSLMELTKRLDRIEGKIDARPAAPAAPALAVADDYDLDGAKGNPKVKFDPKRWTGQSFKGEPLSACSSEFLLAYAEALQYSADHPKAGKEKYAQYDALDAARCRGWAKRNERPAAPPDEGDGV